MSPAATTRLSASCKSPAKTQPRDRRTTSIPALDSLLRLTHGIHFKLYLEHLSTG